MNVIITGSTGMVGEAVLIECLESPNVQRVLLLNRRPLQRKHHKISEIIHADFTDFGDVHQAFLAFRPDACFHCMGVSSVGLDEAAYDRLTFGVTKNLVDHIHKVNPNAVFTYVSGAGTDETERGRIMWARVKGKTENYVLNKGFRDAYAYRIGAVIPQKGVKSRTGWVNILYTLTKPFHGLLQRADSIITSSQLGQSMIRVVEEPVEVKRLENSDIGRLAL